MLTRYRCGFAAARINQQNLSATGADGLQAVFDIRRGHQTAVGSQRIAAQNDQKVGAVDIRYRNLQLMSEQVITGHVVRQLIDRRRGKLIAGAQQAQQRRPE